jgi:hypothetical protein
VLDDERDLGSSEIGFGRRRFDGIARVLRREVDGLRFDHRRKRLLRLRYRGL